MMPCLLRKVAPQNFRSPQFTKPTGTAQHYKAAGLKNLRKLLEDRSNARVRNRDKVLPVTTTKRQHNKSSRLRITQAKKLSISIVGAGRLGLALGLALKDAGYLIDLVVTRRPSSAKRAGVILHAAAAHVGRKPLFDLPLRYAELLARTDVIIIATPDDSIAQIAVELGKLLQSEKTTRHPSTSVVMHTSGALTSRVLQPLQQLGFSTASLHPLISISDSSRGAEAVSCAYISLEGDAAAIRLAKRLMSDLGGDTFVIKAKHKPLYHAAALMASPNLTALFDVSAEMMTRCGLSMHDALQVLLPLVRSTVDNLAHQKPARALTGTFKRGDIGTIKKHLDAIASQRLTDALIAYAVLGKRSVKLSSLTAKQKMEIELLLDRALRRRSKRR